MLMFLAVLFIMVGVGLVVLIGGVITIYNRLVGMKADVDRTWSNIEVLEKQRYDEIPNLVRVCEGYMQHERATLERVTAARTRCMEAKTPSDVAKADAGLGSALKTLFAVAESYPALKANENFLQLQGRVSALETQIAGRRESYNGAAASFNARIRQVPDVLVAALCSFTARDLFAIPDEQKEVPTIAFNIPG